MDLYTGELSLDHLYDALTLLRREHVHIAVSIDSYETAILNNFSCAQAQATAYEQSGDTVSLEKLIAHEQDYNQQQGCTIRDELDTYIKNMDQRIDTALGNNPKPIGNAISDDPREPSMDNMWPVGSDDVHNMSQGVPRLKEAPPDLEQQRQAAYQKMREDFARQKAAAKRGIPQAELDRDYNEPVRNDVNRLRDLGCSVTYKYLDGHFDESHDIPQYYTKLPHGIYIYGPDLNTHWEINTSTFFGNTVTKLVSVLDPNSLKLGTDVTVPDRTGWGSDYQRGHILAKMLGGFGNLRENIFPIYKTTNNRDMKEVEQEVAEYIKNNPNSLVRYTVELSNYKPATGTMPPIPGTIHIRATSINGPSLNIDRVLVNPHP